MAELKGVNAKQIKEDIEKILKDTGLFDVKNKLIKNLSRGYKQRVSLAGALIGNPKILILDEPTVGLDPKQITEIRNLIKSLGKKHTVILSSHILSEVSQICEKVIIINKGKIVAIDTPENLENRAKGENTVIVTVEDTENKINDVVKEIKEVKDIKLVKDNEDGTKQYIINSEGEVDLRKVIFEKFAKEGITIFELKKSEATLEDAFLKIINNDENMKKEENVKNNKKEGDKK